MPHNIYTYYHFGNFNVSSSEVLLKFKKCGRNVFHIRNKNFTFVSYRDITNATRRVHVSALSNGGCLKVLLVTVLPPARNVIHHYRSKCTHPRLDYNWSKWQQEGKTNKYLTIIDLLVLPCHRHRWHRRGSMVAMHTSDSQVTAAWGMVCLRADEGLLDVASL